VRHDTAAGRPNPMDELEFSIPEGHFRQASMTNLVTKVKGFIGALVWESH